MNYRSQNVPDFNWISVLWWNSIVISVLPFVINQKNNSMKENTWNNISSRQFIILDQNRIENYLCRSHFLFAIKWIIIQSIYTLCCNIRWCSKCFNLIRNHWSFLWIGSNSHWFTEVIKHKHFFGFNYLSCVFNHLI